MDRVDELRELAVWYREQAERGGNPAIWNSRLTTAEKLEEEAALLETATRSCTSRGDISVKGNPRVGGQNSKKAPPLGKRRGTGIATACRGM